MNLFAGNFTTKNDQDIPDLDYDIFKITENTFYILGGSENITSTQELISELESSFGEIIFHNITLESENKLEILESEGFGEIYETTTFSGPHVEFEEILERFVESEGAICVREGNISDTYQNREIIVDFMY